MKNMRGFSLLLDNYYKNKDIIKKLLEFFEALGNDTMLQKPIERNFQAYCLSR